MVVTGQEVQTAWQYVVGTGFLGVVARWVIARVGVAKVQKLNEFVIHHSVLARKAVLFAQQAYSDFSGKAKFDVAAEYLSKELAKIGVKMSAQDIEILIESALKDAKNEFGDAWNPSSASSPSNETQSDVKTIDQLTQTGSPSL